MRDAIAFHVIDSTEGNSARGDLAGSMRGAVRPMLKWETKYETDNTYIKTADKARNI